MNDNKLKELASLPNEVIINKKDNLSYEYHSDLTKEEANFSQLPEKPKENKEKREINTIPILKKFLKDISIPQILNKTKKKFNKRLRKIKEDNKEKPFQIYKKV